MWTDAFERLIHGAQRALPTLIPQLHDRIPVTKEHIPYAILPFIPFTYLAYLARQPNTYIARLLLLPIVLVLVVGTAFHFKWTDPRLNVYNWGQSLLAETLAAKAIQYALTKEGMLKMGETSPGVRSITKSGGKASFPNGSPSTSPSTSPLWFYDTMELMISMRGLGWKYGAGVHVPKQCKSLDRVTFLKSTALSFVKNYLILDFLESCIKLIPGVGTPQGGSIFFPELPLFQRFLVSTTIHIFTGSCLLHGFQMVYDLITIIAVGILQSPISSWPPILDDPWSSDSLHIFWAKRWHQFLRETFFIYGGYLGQLLAGNLGMVFGTFIGSGLYHEGPMYAMGYGFDARVPLFFALQGPLLMSERLWRTVTGKRVGGIYGRLWVYFCIIVLGQPLVDGWHRRGLGGGLVLPPSISPARLAFIPFLRNLMER